MSTGSSRALERSEPGLFKGDRARELLYGGPDLVWSRAGPFAGTWVPNTHAQHYSDSRLSRTF